MANTVITHQAQKLRIKSMRNSHFKLVVNIKNADGSNYDFTSDTTDTTLGDDLHILIYASPGQLLYNSIGNVEGSQNLGSTLLTNDMNKTVEDGKLTIEWDATTNLPYAPWPGKYKYHIFTVDANNKQYVWLHGDFIVEDQNDYTPNVSIFYEPEPEPEEEEEQVP